MSRVFPFRLRKRAKVAAADTGRDLGGDEEARYRPIEWPMIRRLLGLLAPYKKRYALGVSLGVVMVILEMLSPQFIGHLVDYTTSYAAGKKPG